MPRSVPQNEIASYSLHRSVITCGIARFSRLMLHAGLRIGEVISLRVGDIYLCENRIPYLRVNGKGQRERIVYLSATASQLLEEYLTSRSHNGEERVFLEPERKTDHGNRNSIAIGQILSPG